MAKEYIEREALISKIFQIGLIDDGRYTINAKAVKTAIDNAPAADVVEVVRCKDCKHYNVLALACMYPRFNGYTGIDGYCSRGERKEV